jgi:16S rRNA (adenine(1408)-N(1))-methyltransferase
VIVVEGKRTREVDGVPAAKRTVVDLGTGDGRYAYALATAHPDWLVVGVDAISERLADYSAKAARKPAKGGRPNLLYVRASAESPPDELHGRADEVHVILPWGALLVGTVDPARVPDVLDGIKALAKPGASLRVVLNAEPWEESLPKDMAALPPVTVEGVTEAYRAAGLAVTDCHDLSADDVRELASTWARRLAASHRGAPHFVGFRVPL